MENPSNMFWIMTGVHGESSGNSTSMENLLLAASIPFYFHRDLPPL